MSNDFKKMGFGQTKVFKLPIVRWELWELKDLFLYDATHFHRVFFGNHVLETGGLAYWKSF